MWRTSTKIFIQSTRLSCRQKSSAAQNIFFKTGFSNPRLLWSLPVIATGSYLLGGSKDQPEMKQSSHVLQPVVGEETTGSKPDDWKAILEKVVPSIVALKLSVPKAFDMSSPGNGWATGFVVNAEKGLILTNRHVVGAGPIVAEAIFHNNEEVPIKAIYRDPVHDFGFFQYDPRDLKYLQNLTPLPLCPEEASVGADIRVVGNDAAEKLCIASGTLARMDRQAPNYGKGRYNDFNTFYYQASSGTTGGSSGSPVLNQAGHVVALNAAGKVGSTASFYLPLDRVKRAYDLIVAGEDVPRGTIQTTFRHEHFDEVKRLGLTRETEEQVRQRCPGETGMLVVDKVPACSSSSADDAQSRLQQGDVLIRCNGHLMTDFVALEDVLDSSVGKTISMEIERGGKLMTCVIPVEDLHAITPSSSLEFAGAVVHPLSYQCARHYGLPPGLPYIATSGYSLHRAGIRNGSIITMVNDQKITCVNDLQDVLQRCQDDQALLIRTKHPSSGSSSTLSVVHLDWKWFPFQSCIRNDRTGYFDCQALRRRMTGHKLIQNNSNPETSPASTTMLLGKNPMESQMAKSLVHVASHRPFSVNGLVTSNYTGAGVVVDATRGYVVVDRNTVPDECGDVRLTIANTLEIPATVVFVHPVHNFSIVQYDPAAVGSTPLVAIDTTMTTTEDHVLVPSDEPVWLVGLSSDRGRNSYTELVSRETQISSVKWVRFPNPNPPRYQEHNVELVALQDVVPSEGGVVCTPDGLVTALWCSFYYQGPGGKDGQIMRGLPIELVMESVAHLATTHPLAAHETTTTPTKSKHRSTTANHLRPEFKLYDLGVDFEPISLAQGRALGLNQARVEALEAHTTAASISRKSENHQQQRTLLSISRRWGGPESAAKRKLRVGDILLEVNGKMVTTFREVERATRDQRHVGVVIGRHGQELELELETVELMHPSNRFVFWQGTILQVPPVTISSQRGVYVSCQYRGSPAARSGLPPTSIIREMDGVAITSLDDCIRIMKAKPKSSSVRIRYTDLGGTAHVTTLQLDSHYWPTSEVLLQEDGKTWQRIVHSTTPDEERDDRF